MKNLIAFVLLVALAVNFADSQTPSRPTRATAAAPTRQQGGAAGPQRTTNPRSPGANPTRPQVTQFKYLIQVYYE